MQPDRIDLWASDEYTFDSRYSFMPNLRCYLHRPEGDARPAMLIVPGGGYTHVSLTEGEIVAQRFYDAGYQAFVLTYTVNAFHLRPVKEQALRDLDRAVRLLRSRAEALSLRQDRLFVCGFSAGGHLAASLAVLGSSLTDPRYPEISGRPDAVVLSYPVITSGPFAHRESFQALLGPSPTKEELEAVSLEKHVSDRTPPVFLWHTATDGSVPVENSLLFFAACRKAGVPAALHVFTRGEHGLSLATAAWANGEFGEDYCSEQRQIIYEAARQGSPAFTDEEKERIEQEHLGMLAWRKLNTRQHQPVPEVSAWPDLALSWLSARFSHCESSKGCD